MSYLLCCNLQQDPGCLPSPLPHQRREQRHHSEVKMRVDRHLDRLHSVSVVTEEEEEVREEERRARGTDLRRSQCKGEAFFLGKIHAQEKERDLLLLL